MKMCGQNATLTIRPHVGICKTLPQNSHFAI
jgi:hypothetical protein